MQVVYKRDHRGTSEMFVRIVKFRTLPAKLGLERKVGIWLGKGVGRVVVLMKQPTNFSATEPKNERQLNLFLGILNMVQVQEGIEWEVTRVGGDV